MAVAWESLFDGSLTLSDTQTESNALADLPARRGVLLFTDEANHPIQLIQTANLRGLSRSRLAAPEADAPRRKADLGAITRHIFYACCDSDLERHFLYQRLTHAVFGKAWKTWLALPRREYAAIDTARAFACFAVTSAVEADPQTTLYGPFPNRRTAAQFCDVLNTAFELCRNPALLDSGTPQSCHYRQMQSCHGLCCQEHGPAEYAELVKKAMACASGHFAQAVCEKETQMKQAAASLDFERANLLKKQAGRLKELLNEDFAWTGRLEDLKILFVDDGPKRIPEGSKKKIRHYQLWRLDVDGAYPMGLFTKEDTAALRSLLDAAALPPVEPPYPYALSRQEHLAAIGYFLYRKTRPGHWYNIAQFLPSAETIMDDLASAKTPDKNSSSDDAADDQGFCVDSR